MGGRAVLTWGELARLIAQWEHGNTDKRITRITSESPDAPIYWRGNWSECEVGHGAASIRLSSGEVIEF